MRHYEICFIVHPDQSEQVPGMVERYKRYRHRQATGSFTAWKTGAAANWLTRSRRSTRRTMF
jgi:ribosomal protein S6